MRKTKTQISFAVTAKLISAFVFATWIVQSLYFLNQKFKAYSHLLWLYSPVCVRPGRKPRRPVFSQRGSYNQHLCCCLESTGSLFSISEIFKQPSTFLAHLSQRLIGELIGYPWSGVRPSTMLKHLLQNRLPDQSQMWSLLG